MSRAYLTDVLTLRQLAFIAEHLPGPPYAPTGRPHYANRELLPGVLRVLRSGCRWRDLHQPGCPSSVTRRRRLRYWHRRRGYRRVWHTLLIFLVQGKRLDRSLVSLDGTLIASQEFMEQPDYSGKHRAVETKLSVLLGRARNPLAVTLVPDNHNGADTAFCHVNSQGSGPPLESLNRDRTVVTIDPEPLGMPQSFAGRATLLNTAPDEWWPYGRVQPLQRARPRGGTLITVDPAG